MASVVGEIVIDVTADIGPLVRQMDKAESAMGGLQGAAASMGRGLNRVGTFTTQLGQKMSIVSAGIAAVAAGAIALTRNAAAMGDAIGDSAKAAGMSTTAFQEYRFAVKEAANMTDDEFAAAATRLNKTLGEARSGAESAVKAFEAIGVSQAQLADASFNADAAMAAFVAKMEATTDPALAAAMATDLFGKAGASLGAGLSGVPGQVGSLVDRARELGVVMNGDAVKAAGEFEQKMNELGAQFEAVKMEIASVLLPVLVNELIPFIQNDVIPAIRDAIDVIGGWVDAFNLLPDGVQTAAMAITTAFAVGGPVLVAIGYVATALAAIVTGPAAPFVLLAAAIVGINALWPEFGAAAKTGFAILGGSVVGAIELIGQLIVTIGAAEQAIVDMFKRLGDGVSNGQTYDGMAGDMNRKYNGYQKDDAAFPGGTARSGGSSSTGASVADGLVDGLTTRMAERLPEVAAAMQTVTDQAKATLGVQSPSTVFAEIGQFIGQGLAQGINSTSGIVGAAVSAMGSGAVSASNAMTSDILSGLDTLLAGSQKGGAALALVNTMIGASQEIKKGTFGFASAARVIAQGMGFIKAIKGAKGSGGAAGGAGSSAAPAAQPVQTLNFNISNDPFGFGERITRQIAAQLNEAGRNGMSLRATVGSSA